MSFSLFPLLETLIPLSIYFLDNVSKLCNIEIMIDNESSELLLAAKLFRILGNPTRLAIVRALYERSWCVCELAEQLSLNKSATSKHLSSLKSVGIIDMQREGTRVNCSLIMPCVMEMMSCAIEEPASEGEEYA